MEEQIAANYIPRINFKGVKYTREEAIAHFTSETFLNKKGAIITYDINIIKTYLNLYFDYHDIYEKIAELNSVKSKYLLAKADLETALSLKK